MAAAIAPELINLITGLVHKSAPAAEAQLGAGTGAAKFGQVFGDVMDALTKAAVAGQISKTLPPDPTVQIIIQAVVQSMKLAGLLQSGPAPAVTSENTIYVKSGQSVMITAQ